LWQPCKSLNQLRRLFSAANGRQNDRVLFDPRPLLRLPVGDATRRKDAATPRLPCGDKVRR